MELIVGADAGGTHTSLVAVSEAGEVLGRLECGGANHNGGALEVCRAHLREGIARLCGQLGRAEADWLSAGLSAWDVEPDEAERRRFLGDLFPAERTLLHSDAYMALVGAACGAPGMVLVSGTGSICLGEDADGGLHVRGGWGFRFGDGGSCYAMGMDALEAVSRAADGVGPATRMLDGLMARFGVTEPRALIGAAYSPPMTVDAVAQLAQVALQCAGEGDAVARGIVSRALAALAGYAQAVAAEMGGDVRELGVYGGLFERNPQLIPRLARRLPGLHVRYPEFPPEIGAVIYHFKRRGKLTPNILEALRRTM